VTHPLFILEQVERSINGKRSKYIEKENQGDPSLLNEKHKLKDNPCQVE
jgi:hypothetical protein